MKRRELIRLFGSAAAAWPLAARAQQGERVRRIGVLVGSLPAGDPEWQARSNAFVQGLQERGWSDGRNLRIEYRWGLGDPDRLRKYVAELVALAPDVVLAAGAPAVAALQQSSRIPPRACEFRRHWPWPSGCRSARCGRWSSLIAPAPAGTPRRGPEIPHRPQLRARARRCAAPARAAAPSPYVRIRRAATHITDHRQRTTPSRGAFVRVDDEHVLSLNAEYAKIWPKKTPPPDSKEWEGKPDKLPILLTKSRRG